MAHNRAESEVLMKHDVIYIPSPWLAERTFSGSRKGVILSTAHFSAGISVLMRCQCQIQPARREEPAAACPRWREAFQAMRSAITLLPTNSQLWKSRARC